jgi:hypothetical protein
MGSHRPAETVAGLLEMQELGNLFESRNNLMLDRRELLKLSAATMAASLLRNASAQQPSSTLTVSDRVLARVPLDFSGLSYESPQLSNPHFFAASNTELVQLYRELAPTGGVLRIGGNLSALTGWRDDPSIPRPALTPAEQALADRGKKYWEWDLTDPTVKNSNREAFFTPECIRALASFLDATGWKAIYGLNFATGSQEQAVAEASCVHKTLGKSLVAFQLGNEDDFWRGGFRSTDWDFDHYFTEWQQWTRAIRAKAPGAPFAGPDVAVRLDWVEKMASAAKNDVVLLSSHHYAMGPAGDPRMTAEHLLGPDEQIAKEIAAAHRATAIAGVPFRNTECNSCFHGGQRGASDSFASALWGADYMLTLMQAGHAGVNLHGGGDGIYSPIVGDSARGFTRRPLYFGMKFAQAFAGAEMLDCTMSAPPSVKGYAARHANTLTVALINKGASNAEVAISLPEASSTNLASMYRLSGAAIDNAKDVTLSQSPTEPHPVSAAWHVPAYSALLLHYS